MNDGRDLMDIHMSRLAGWAMNTIGKAVALSLLVAFVGGFVVAVWGEPLLYGLVGIAAPLTFGLVLYMASPPFPDE